MQRVTLPAASVLQAIADGAGYGFSIMEATDLASGTVYQVLRRFECSGLVSSQWEQSAESAGTGRPRRRYYELTQTGEETLARVAARYARRANPFAERLPSG